MVRSPETGPSRFSIPSEGLLELWDIRNGLIGNIGESSITLATGTAADLMNASWQFPDTAVTQQVDTLLGGGVLFTVRFGYDWYALFNDDYAWIGPKGIVFYSQSMTDFAGRIQRFLGYYTATALEMLANLEMLSSLEMR